MKLFRKNMSRTEYLTNEFIISVSNRVNSKKKHAFDSLKGSLKSTSSLKEIKEERLLRYEVTNS